MAAALAGFSGGFLVCRYRVYSDAAAKRSALAVDARFHAPEVRLRPGYYWIAAPHAPMWLDVVSTKAGALRKISLFRAASRGRSSMTFEYFPKSRFRVPVVSLLTVTGYPPRPHCWVNVGLRHHFLIQSWPHQGRPRTEINGRWVKFRGGPGNTIRSNGRKYRYHKTTGGWVPISAVAPPDAKKLSAGKYADRGK